jgi:hypothetical protein
MKKPFTHFERFIARAMAPNPLTRIRVNREDNAFDVGLDYSCRGIMPLFQEPNINNENVYFYPACGESMFGGIRYYNESISFNGEMVDISVKVYPKIIHCLKKMTRIEWLGSKEHRNIL